MKTETLLLTLTLIAAAAFAAKPNLVFIMMDDLGYGDTSCYNPQSKIRTPHIDALAESGMRFTDAHSPCSWCIPSRYGLLTGRFPTRTDDYHIKAGTPTIASYLRDRGYATGMVGKWHNGFDNKNEWNGVLGDGPCGCGFETFFGIPHSLDIQPYLYIENDRAVQPPSLEIERGKVVTQGIYPTEGWNDIQGAFWRKGKIAPGFKHDEVLGKFTARALEFLDKQSKAKPFFLYLAYAGPHTPWLPSREFTGKSGAGIYGDFMMEIDEHVGQIVKKVKDDFAENTLIVVTSDNGPVWYEKDVERLGHNSIGALRGMKGDALEAGHRVPFIAAWPGRIPAGGTCDQTVCFTDLLRTMSAIIGEPLQAGVGIDSVDISPLLFGEGSRQVRDVTVHQGIKLAAIRKGDYKLIPGQGTGGTFNERKPPEGAPKAQLYNMKKDPGESNNLYANPEYATVRKDLESELEKLRGSNEGWDRKW